MTDRSRRDDSADSATEAADGDGESNESDSGVPARVGSVATETVGLVVDAVIEAL
jgi:hypothetical protein